MQRKRLNGHLITKTLKRLNRSASVAHAACLLCGEFTVSPFIAIEPTISAFNIPSAIEFGPVAVMPSGSVAQCHVYACCFCWCRSWSVWLAHTSCLHRCEASVRKVTAMVPAVFPVGVPVAYILDALTVVPS